MLLPSVSVVGLLRRERFAELAARLAAGAHLRAGLEPEARIAGAVAEDLRRVMRYRCSLLSQRASDLGDAAVLHRRRVEGGVEQQRDVGLADHLVVEQQVPQFPAALGVVDGIGEPELFDQPALAPAGPCRCASWRRRRASSLRSRSCRPAASGPGRGRPGRPCRAAAMAAQTPASPPPATSTSASSGTTLICASFVAKAAVGGAICWKSGRGVCASARSARTMREYPKKSRRFTPIILMGFVGKGAGYLAHRAASCHCSRAAPWRCAL